VLLLFGKDAFNEFDVDERHVLFLQN